MNRDLESYSDIDSHKFNHHIGEQPRKSTWRKNKKSQVFNKFNNELDDIEKDRHSYNRASSKNVARIQLRTGQILF